MKTQIIQKAVVLNDEDKMLMVRRSKTDVRRPLEWDLPGGLCEEGEELAASLEREILEETGLEVKDSEPVYAKTEVRSWKDDEGNHEMNVVFIFFIAKAVSTGVKLSYEHDKFQWKPMSEAAKEYEYYLHKELLEHIISNDLHLLPENSLDK